MFTAPSISCQTNSLSLPRERRFWIGTVWREGQNMPLFYANQSRSPFNIGERQRRVSLQINMQTLKAQSIRAGKNCGCFATRSRIAAKNNNCRPNWAISADGGGFAQWLDPVRQKQVKFKSFAAAGNDVASWEMSAAPKDDIIDSISANDAVSPLSRNRLSACFCCKTPSDECFAPLSSKKFPLDICSWDVNASAQGKTENGNKKPEIWCRSIVNLTRRRTCTERSCAQKETMELRANSSVWKYSTFQQKDNWVTHYLTEGFFLKSFKEVETFQYEIFDIK